MKKAFTLTEIMVALAVVAILTAILMPMIFKLRPNQEVLMTKRAYNQTLSIVSEMINNEKCYPLVYDRTGFGDERPYTCSQNGARNTKFVNLFMEYLNPIERNDNTATTKDGMLWTFNSNFTGNGGNATITVDTTGAGIARHNDTFRMRIQANGKIEIVDGWAQEAVKVDRKFVGE